MILLAYLPIVLYFSLEFARRTPLKERKLNNGSSTLIGAVFPWMIIIPSLIYFFWSKGHSTSALYIGVLIGLFGVWTRSVAIKTLGRFYSRNIGVQHEHRVVQTGLYRYIRNPGYLGTLLTFVGFAIATSSGLAVGINLILFLIAYTYRIKVEEKALIEEFGNEYRQYMTKSWRLIPFVY